MKLVQSKKGIIAIIAIALLLIAICGATYSIYINNKQETIAPPMEAEKQTLEENKNEVDISELQEETTENTLEENIEQNEIEENTKKEEKNNTNQTNNTNNTNKTNNTNGTTPYYIKVNYGAQVVTIYKQDENGAYTVPVKAMVCSTGTATPTSGVYSIPARWEWLRLQGYVWGHYTTQIKGNILFHSVPYLRKGDLASLEYWEYDKLGTSASAGCVRLTVQDAKWIYDNCKNGTKVEFYSSSNPGPLGKPSAKKISSYEDYLRNWDPTDPSANNPWKSYKEEQKTNTNNNNSQNEVTKNETTNQGTTNQNEATKTETTNQSTDKKNETSKEENSNQKEDKNTVT